MARPNYRFLNEQPTQTHLPDNDSAFELNESDLYYSQLTSDTCTRPFPGSRLGPLSSKQFNCVGSRTSRPSSLPVNIPDWSKILREEYRENIRRDGLANDYLDDDDDEEEEEYDDDSGGDVYGGDGTAAPRGRNIRLPPHEFLARQMARTRICCSFSVHEGVGRTLKGRDLSRVRNAIWEKTGFQD